MPRYTLDLEDFGRLVRGRSIQAGGVELLLADVGFDYMERQIRQARAAARMPAPAAAVDTTNRWLVYTSADGERVGMMRPPVGDMTSEQALVLAATLVALADPAGDRFDPILQAVWES